MALNEACANESLCPPILESVRNPRKATSGGVAKARPNNRPISNLIIKFLLNFGAIVNNRAKTHTPAKIVLMNAVSGKPAYKENAIEIAIHAQPSLRLFTVCEYATSMPYISIGRNAIGLNAAFVNHANVPFNAKNVAPANEEYQLKPSFLKNR